MAKCGTTWKGTSGHKHKCILEGIRHLGFCLCKCGTLKV